jgi:tripartite-type tricarboxylate transporter receptor subunit TctC
LPVLAATRPTAAQNFPSRPIKIIVPFPPGGGVDLTARLLMEPLSKELGQPIVVENKGGAGGIIGVEAMSHAPADGYTLALTGVGTLTAGPHLRKMPYDPMALSHITRLVRMPFIVAVRNDLPAKTLPEFMELAKKTEIRWASGGIGTSQHLAGELFTQMSGLKMVHVPYRGTGPALNDIVAGHVDLIFMELSAAYKLHEGGKARILAVATDKRLDLLPGIPTMIEVGVPNFISDTWNAISAPPKTPKAIIGKLNRAINDILAEPETVARFRDLNLTPAGGSPDDMARLKKEETERWTKVIRDASIQPE